MVSVPAVGTLGRRLTRSSTGIIYDVDLFCEVNRLLDAAVSENTKRAYASGTRSFDEFRSVYNRSLDWPPSLQDVVDFIAHFSAGLLATSTVRSYISAVSYRCKIQGFVDPTQSFVVSKLMKGMSRLHNRSDKRLPVTLSLLCDLIKILPAVCSSNFEASLFAAAFSVAFFGFFRVDELVSSSGAGLEHVISIADVKFLNDNTLVELGLRSSKTDANAEGAVLTLQAVDTLFCPVKLLRRYIALRPSVAGPLFCHFGGQPLTRFQFNSVLCKACCALGIDCSKYRSHSFRIGAVSLASSKGLSDDEIRACSRWSEASFPFKRYIRIPVRALIR